MLNATYQINDKNRLTGFYSRHYKKPNRFLAATNLLEQASTSNEDDVFDVYQVLWNSVLSNNLFIDARLGLNKIFFPTYLNGNDQTLLDAATGIRTRNFTAGTERWRDRYQGNATGQYYLDEWLGGRHEFKFGFDHAHAPVENRVSRFDDVDLTWNSNSGLSQVVTIFGTPFYSKSAVDVTALYAQDSYSVKRLTLTAGVRWERLEAYPPEQNSPASAYFPNLVRSFRRSATSSSVHGGPGQRRLRPVRQRPDGAQFGAGRSTTSSRRRRHPRHRQPERQLLETYGWNDRNGDLRFQPGEQTGNPVISQST